MLYVMHIIQILDWLQKKKGKFTSHDTQNEILKLMALSVLREIAVNLQRTELYTIMADECADVGNRETSLVCMHLRTLLLQLLCQPSRTHWLDYTWH